VLCVCVQPRVLPRQTTAFAQKHSHPTLSPVCSPCYCLSIIHFAPVCMYVCMYVCMHACMYDVCVWGVEVISSTHLRENDVPPRILSANGYPNNHELVVEYHFSMGEQVHTHTYIRAGIHACTAVCRRLRLKHTRAHVQVCAYPLANIHMY